VASAVATKASATTTSKLLIDRRFKWIKRISQIHPATLG
jgi:hypothetical protein